MAIDQKQPPEVMALLEANPDAVYLDVRTEGEFEAGHPVSAINIPVALPGPGGQMMPTPEFLSVVEGALQKNQKIVCGCQVGGRSQMAADIMAQAGYPD